VAISADGRHVATSSDDHTARVFEAASGKEVSRFIHQGAVWAVAFSADGRQVATGSDDNTAPVFEAASGKEVSRMTLSGPVAAIRYTEDGRYLMTLSVETSSKELILTRHFLSPQDLTDDACSRLTRNLTPDEWRQYAGPEIPYHRTCPNLP
jgi:WD40 repeat protein